MSETSVSTHLAPEQTERDFYPTRGSRFLSVLFAAGLGGFSLFMAAVLLGRGDPYGIGFAAVAAWAGTMTVQWFHRLRGDRPSLALTDEGLLDGTALGAPIFIPWGDIGSVSGDGSSTTLELRDDSHIRVPLVRRLQRVILRRPPGAYVILTKMLDTPSFAIEAFVREWHESLLLEQVNAEKKRFHRGSGDSSIPSTNSLVSLL